MDRDDVVKILRSCQAELRAAGVEHLHLFGSVARGDQTPSSAIDLAAEMRDLAAEMRDLAAEMRDLAAEMSTANEWTLLTLGGMQIELIDWLGADVNLSLLSWFRPSLRERVLHGAVDAFSRPSSTFSRHRQEHRLHRGFPRDTTAEQAAPIARPTQPSSGSQEFLPRQQLAWVMKQNYCVQVRTGETSADSAILRHAYNHIDLQAM